MCTYKLLDFNLYPVYEYTITCSYSSIFLSDRAGNKIFTFSPASLLCFSGMMLDLEQILYQE